MHHWVEVCDSVMIVLSGTVEESMWVTYWCRVRRGRGSVHSLVVLRLLVVSVADVVEPTRTT